MYPSDEAEDYLFNPECTIQDLHRTITEHLQSIDSCSPDPHNFRVWLIDPLRELSRRQLTLRQMQVTDGCSVLVMPPDVTPPPFSNVEQPDPSINFNSTSNNAENRSNQVPANNYAPNQNASSNFNHRNSTGNNAENRSNQVPANNDAPNQNASFNFNSTPNNAENRSNQVPASNEAPNQNASSNFNLRNSTDNNAENRSNQVPANNDAPNQNATDIPNTKITLKIIVCPGKTRDEFHFNEDRTIQDVHNHVAELLQFKGIRYPNPQNFSVWQIRPFRKLSKPQLTLRQMQVPRQCSLLVMPADAKPPPLSNLDELDQLLSAINSTITRNKAGKGSHQVKANNGASNQNRNQTNSTEESAPKEKCTRKRKSSTKKVDPKNKRRQYITSDSEEEQFSESNLYSCNICPRNFDSRRAVRSHLTKTHKISKKTTEKKRAVQRVKAVKKEQPKKKAKENKNYDINITVNNTMYYNYNCGLSRGDFY